MADDIPETSRQVGARLRDGLNVLAGGNFSGRTAFLKSISGVEPPNDTIARSSAYLGPEPETALSGLTLSVSQELAAHRVDLAADELLDRIWPSLSLEPLYSRVPHTLSGGETAKLVLACALLLRPETLSVDGTLEQVDSATRLKIFQNFELGETCGRRICIADNRISEEGFVANLQPPPDSARPASLAIDATNYPIRTVTPVNIDLHSVAYRYQSGLPPVLKDITVMFEPGQVYYLEGVNGSGKSTLAKVLCGVVRPQKGSLFANRRPYLPWFYGNDRVSYHFQNPDRGRLRQTLRRELEASVHFMGSQDTPSVVDTCLQIATALGLGAVLDQPIDLLPYTVRKRIALAAALAPNVPWIFLDEPSLGQADDAVSALAKILAMEVRNGRGIIIVSHAAALRSQLPGQRLLLRDGQLDAPGRGS